MGEVRPYRSHRIPACAFCRHRRVRCSVDLQGQPCRLCRKNDVECSTASKTQGSRTATSNGALLQQRSVAQPMEGLSHILGPVVARDTHDLNRHLGKIDGQPDNDLNRAGKSGNLGSCPIYHVPIPPPRPRAARGPRNLPKELINKVMPHLHRLMVAFYEKLHPCYPITDEDLVLRKIRDKYLPEGFMVGLLTYSTFYWDTLLGLPVELKPDHFAACQAAFLVNTEDIQKTGVWTILALCYNLAGRPSKCLVGNIANVSRIVGLAQAIGLHHDCSQWNISDAEKRIRSKAWWGVLIQDQWFHLAHGTPAHIAQDHHDVALPTLDLLLHEGPPSMERRRSAETYIALCRLTEILGNLLPLIYHMRSGTDTSASEKRRQVEISLQQWLQECPGWMEVRLVSTRANVPGLPNLVLSYLAINMLLRQITWHQLRENHDDSALLLIECKDSAEDIVAFVQSLQNDELSGFWLPHNAHHFTAATTLLLRCSVQATTPEVSAECLATARTLVNCLQEFTSRQNWDLAETVLPQNAKLISRVDSILASQGTATGFASPYSSLSETLKNTDASSNSADALSVFNDPMLADIFPELFADTPGNGSYSTIGDIDLEAEFDFSSL